MKNLIRKILKESNKEKFIHYIASKIKAPYFKNLKKIDVEKNEIKPILSLVFNQPILIENLNVYNKKGNLIYDEDSDGNWKKREYDEKGNLIYIETSDGDWQKREYNEKNNVIYLETSDGYWMKREYNKRNKLIYSENSNDGVILDKR